jgi:GMP synthase-like glutamine amidotransferase
VGGALLVVTEQPDHLTPERQEGYARFARTLAEASGTGVRTAHYTEVDDLGRGPVVLSGSKAPWAAHDPAELERFRGVLRATEAPVLGVCAGLQLLAEAGGGRVRPMAEAGRPPERGYGPVDVLEPSGLLAGLGRRAIVFHDHEDEVVELPPGFRLLARSDGSEVQAFAADDRLWWGTQFHPERHDGEHPDGARILANFFALARDDGRSNPPGR